MSLHPQGQGTEQNRLFPALSHQHSSFYFLMRSPRGARGLGSGGGEGVTGGTPCKGPLSTQEGPSLLEQWGICQGAWGGGTIRQPELCSCPGEAGGAAEDGALSALGSGLYSPAYFAPSWLTHRGRQPGFWLATEGLSTCTHHICSGCPQLSLNKQTLTPALPAAPSPHQTQLA